MAAHSTTDCIIWAPPPRPSHCTHTLECTCKIETAEKFNFARNPCVCAQVKGGCEEYQDGILWKAAQIIGKRASRAGIEYRVTWDGYDMTYDTWEPCENIVDTSLIDEFVFEASIDMFIPLQQPVGQLREAVAARMMKIKAPEKGVSVDVPLAVFLPVARALLAHAARPPSRRGRKPLQLEYDTGSGWPVRPCRVRSQTCVHVVPCELGGRTGRARRRRRRRAGSSCAHEVGQVRVVSRGVIFRSVKATRRKGDGGKPADTHDRTHTRA